MTDLLSPLPLRGLTLPNRFVVSPMCQYSARGGVVGDYHLVHLGRFALGGFGTVIVEATAVTAEGRITYGCPGLWDDAQIAGMARITALLRAQGAVAGIQLAHAGRKASSIPPWLMGTDEREADAEHWEPVAPSALLHAEDAPMPRAMSEADIEAEVAAWAAATKRAVEAGFQLIEIHGAHGYLLNQFLSPLSNRREDAYGGSAENRMRFPLQVVEAVRAAMPEDMPLFLRLSAVDGLDGGRTIEDSVAFARAARDRGVDVIDVSAGGFTGSRFEIGPGMYLPWAAQIREDAGLPVMAVGLMGEAELAAEALSDGRADLIGLGRAALDDPNWPLHAARQLGTETRALWPKQAGYAIERWPGRNTAKG